MAGNMDNGFGGFDDSDGFDFGGDMSGGFGDDFDSGFGNSDGGFGAGGFGDDVFSGAGQQDMGQANQFSDSLNNFDNQNQYLDMQAEQQNTKKQSIIFIIVGVVVLLVVLVIAGIFNNKSKNNNVTSSSNGSSSSQVVQQDPNVNVDDIMGGGNNSKPQQNQNNTQQSVVTNKVDDGFTWTLISNNEAVQFNNEYSDMTFTITGIEHKARAVDTNSNLVVITTLQGSISGLSGTYELDVPYNKGVKLVVGNSFTVHVQLGTYNGKTVVGEIQY